MKVVVHIPALNPAEYGAQLTQRLAAIFPSGLEPHSGWFGIRLPLDDPRCSDVLQGLEQAGLKPWESRNRPIKRGVEFSVNYIRTYDDADLDACTYLQLLPDTRLESVLPKTVEEAKSRNLVHIALADIDPSFDFMLVDRCHAVVPRRVRMLLDGAGLIGLAWRPIVLWDSHKRSNRRIEAEAFDDLIGERILPPVSPTVELYDSRTKQRVAPGHPDPVRLQEGLYTPVEPHYRAADLEAFGPFDVARTFERPWGGDHNRHIIVSSRFYRFCREHRLRTGFVPVRIEE